MIEAGMIKIEHEFSLLFIVISDCYRKVSFSVSNSSFQIRMHVVYYIQISLAHIKRHISSSQFLYPMFIHVRNIYRLIHGHFHIGLVIIPRPPYWPETESRANMGRGIITRTIWKYSCIKLFITYFQHLEKRHPYQPETKSRPILARTNMGLDMEMILQ